MGTDTTYLGLRLPHPFIAGASPFGYHLERVKRLEDAGCAAVVLHSLFEEQIEPPAERRDNMLSSTRDIAGTLDDFPSSNEYPLSPDAYADHILRIKRAVGIPVIASLNGTSAKSWLRFARVVEQAGADALELNCYEVVTDLDVSGSTVEERLVTLVKELKRSIRLPVAVKLSPFFAAFGNVARKLDEAGADGLVLFNRFYQPDIDISTLRVHPHLELSTNAELQLRLRWLAILHGRVRPSLAVTGGVATPSDGIKALLAGADAVQLVSALLRHGPAYLTAMRQGLERWMEWNKVTSLRDLIGRSSLETTPDPTAFERANYIRALQSWGSAAGS